MRKSSVIEAVVFGVIIGVAGGPLVALFIILYLEFIHHLFVLLARRKIKKINAVKVDNFLKSEGIREVYMSDQGYVYGYDRMVVLPHNYGEEELEYAIKMAKTHPWEKRERLWFYVLFFIVTCIVYLLP